MSTDGGNTEPWFDVERSLKADESGAERDALLERLRGRAAEIKREQDKGVPPGRFEQLAILRGGLEAAAQVVAALWYRHHSG